MTLYSDVTGVTTSRKTRFHRVQGRVKYTNVSGQCYKLKYMGHLECTTLCTVRNDNKDIFENIQLRWATLGRPAVFFRKEKVWCSSLDW
jgi:hypothetical protein